MRRRASLLWTLGRGAAIAGAAPLLDRAVELSARHGVDVCRALGAGVLEALTALVVSLHASAPRRSRPASLRLDDGRTALRAVDSRFSTGCCFCCLPKRAGCVPMWHPVYRDRYSLETIVTTLARRTAAVAASGRRCRRSPGWRTRRVHAPASCGSNAFNGRLFSPSARVRRTFDPDQVMARRSRQWRRVAGGGAAPTPRGAQPRRSPADHLSRPRRRAAWRRVRAGARLRAADRRAALLERTGDLRKASGTLLHAAVGHGLSRPAARCDPLVEGRSASEILRPSGSRSSDGQRRVSRCRLPATWQSAAEDALIREGRWHPGDVTAADRSRAASRGRAALPLRRRPQSDRGAAWRGCRSGWRRWPPTSRCRFSIIASSAGDSLVGATPDDVQRQPPKVTGRRPARGVAAAVRWRRLCDPALEHAVRIAARACTAKRTTRPQIVRDKERALAALTRERHAAGPLDRVCSTSGAPAGSGSDGISAGPCDVRRAERRASSTIAARCRPASPATLLASVRRHRAATGDSCTGRWPFPRCSPTRPVRRQPTPASTPCSATRRGTWCEATAARTMTARARRQRCAGQLTAFRARSPASTASRRGRTSTGISCSSSGRSN